MFCGRRFNLALVLGRKGEEPLGGVVPGKWTTKGWRFLVKWKRWLYTDMPSWVPALLITKVAHDFRSKVRGSQVHFSQPKEASHVV